MSSQSKELASLYYNELRDCGVRHVVGVPDRETNSLWQCFVNDRDARAITTSREGEAASICAGLYLAGHQALYCIKNFGLFESLDSVRMVGMAFGTPLLMFIGYAGRPRPGIEEEMTKFVGNTAAQVLIAGQWTSKILQAIDVPHYTIDKPEDAQVVRAAALQAKSECRPVALLGELP
jgi:sulfopyruvate decarboxylase TPP-binding subunit